MQKWLDWNAAIFLHIFPVVLKSAATTILGNNFLAIPKIIECESIWPLRCRKWTCGNGSLLWKAFRVRVRLGSITVNSFGFKVLCTFIAEFVQKGHKCKRNRLEDGHIWMVPSPICTNCTVNNIFYIYSRLLYNIYKYRYTVSVVLLSHASSAAAGLAIYQGEPPRATAIPVLTSHSAHEKWDLATSKLQSWPGNCSAPESSGSDPVANSIGKHAAKWEHDLWPMDLQGICKCFICLCHRYKTMVYCV